ncbi:PilW family protein [Granulosicoccaceae sp. 1_MG-2023]|nr:PilW family protein [Granulosicoccaceae sp. 1_MG-2023]
MKSRIQRQHGLSLIELMVSLVVGLLILAGVVNIFIASRQTTQFSDGLRSMQENGRQGVFVLQNAIRAAGFSTETTTVDPVVLGQSGTEQIAIFHEADTDCNGTSTATATTPGFAIDVYSFDDTNKQLTCLGDASAAAGASATPLVDNVWDFRVLYGLDSDADGVTERYVDYSEVSSAADVSAIKFGLLVRTDLEVKDEAETRDYTILNDRYAVTDDKYGYQVYQSSVIIRNKGT